MNLKKGQYVDMIGGPEVFDEGSELIVEVTSDTEVGLFSGVVVRGNTKYEVGYSSNIWVECLFKITEKSYLNG